jgi:hypothetical protein
MVADVKHFQDRLAEARKTASRLRCEAFVDYSPVIAGQRLKQITLPTYNQLCAFECEFVKSLDVGFKDIVCFVWVHHPEFHQFNEKVKMRVTHEVWRALNPRYSVVQSLVRLLAPLPRFRWVARWIRPTAAELQIEAVAEIRRLLHEALHDFPKDGPKEAGEPLAFSFQAQVLNLMRRSLGLTFAETSSIPLKALAQHLREILHVESHGKAMMLTPEEAQVWSEYLEAREQEGRELAQHGKN